MFEHSPIELLCPEHAGCCQTMKNMQCLWVAVFWLFAAVHAMGVEPSRELFSDDCPSGFSLLSGSSTLCVQLMSTPMYISPARGYCRANGGTLVSILSAEENSALATMTSGRTFVGGTQDSDGRWHWENFQSLTYTNWGPGQPDNAYGSEHCLAIAPGGLWNDYSCFLDLPSICAVRLSPTSSPTASPQSDSSSSSSDVDLDPAAIGGIVAAVVAFVALFCCGTRCCCRFTIDVNALPATAPAAYVPVQNQAAPAAVAVASYAASAPPMAYAFAESTKVTATAVVAFADTGDIELQPVASAPPAPAAYHVAASAPYAATFAAAAAPAAGPISTYSRPQHSASV